MCKKVCLISALFIFLLSGLNRRVMALEWNWWGYFGANYIDSDQKGEQGGFDAFALSLIPQINLNDKTSIRAQIFFEHSPFYNVTEKEIVTEVNLDQETVTKEKIKVFDQRSSGEIILTDAYLDYSFSELLGLRFGKFFTPFGIYNTIYYAMPLYPTIRIPGTHSVYEQDKEPHNDAHFYPRFSHGLWLYGNTMLKDLNLTYDLYLSNGRSQLAGYKDDNSNKGLGGKLTLGLPFSDFGLDRFDLSYSGYREQSEIPDKGKSEIQNTSLISFDLAYSSIAFRSEIVFSRRGKRDMKAYYLLGDYTFKEKVTPFAGYSVHEPDQDLANDRERTILLGINYHIIPWLTTVKFELDLVDFEDPAQDDYKKYIIGVAAAF